MWSITPDHPQYSTINEMFTDAKKNNLIIGVDDAPSILGFSGFVVQESGQEYLSASFVIGPQTIELQKCLLDTAPESEVDQSFKEVILNDIDIFCENLAVRPWLISKSE